MTAYPRPWRPSSLLSTACCPAWFAGPWRGAGSAIWSPTNCCSTCSRSCGWTACSNRTGSWACRSATATSTGFAWPIGGSTASGWAVGRRSATSIPRPCPGRTKSRRRQTTCAHCSPMRRNACWISWHAAPGGTPTGDATSARARHRWASASERCASSGNASPNNSATGTSLSRSGDGGWPRQSPDSPPTCSATPTRCTCCGSPGHGPTPGDASDASSGSTRPCAPARWTRRCAKP